MTIYDGAMVGIVVLGMIWGAWRGITWQLASIASLVLGYLVGFPLSAQLAPHFPGEPIVARSLALLASYAGVSGAIFLAAWVVRATLREWKFEAYDRHLGMVLGGLEGAVIGLVVTLFVVSFAPATRTPIFSSRAGHVVSWTLDSFGPVLPGEIRKELEPVWAQVEGTAPAADIAEAPATSNPAPAAAADPNSADPGSKVLDDLVNEGEARVGQAIHKAVEKGVDWARERDSERR